MSDGDLYVSNGTCYFGRGQIADRHFIPCGNAVENGPQACCYEGDYCLSSNTCWDNTTIVTYVAGCTDPSFSSSKCIQKNGYPNQQWVAMARCDSPNIDIWSGCAKHPNVTAIQKEDCDCTSTAPLIRNPNGKSSFDEIASLPQTVMGSISFNPTALPTRGAGDTSSSSSGTASASASIPGPTSEGSSGGSSGLSHSAQIGVGVGVGVGGAILLAIIAFMVYRLRRQKKTAAPPQYETQPQHQPQQQQQQPQEGRPQTVSPDPGNAGDPDRAQQASPELTTVRTNTVSPELDAGMWDKPELSGDPTTRSELPTRGATKREHVSELPGET
ncbi:hypothetical protein PG985_006169 [Apiospora marii]|uniref:Uncharacterized protein n=1 Tax=Apiospora marii TaxID=335849 RepID=A0ABR1S6W3_9PEZI